MAGTIETISLERFQADVVNKSKKQITLVKFGGDWCGDSRRLDETQTLEKIAATNRRVRVVKVDVQGEQTAEAYYIQKGEREPNTLLTPLVEGKITNYPTLMIYDNGVPRNFFTPDPTIANGRRDRIIDGDITTKGAAIITEAVKRYTDTPHPIRRIRRTLRV